MSRDTKTLERSKETDYVDTGTTSSRSSSEPPSWSELFSKMKSSEKTTGKTATNTALTGATTLALGFLLPFGGWLLPIFAASAIGSSLGFGDVKSGAISGGAIAGITSFFGSIILSIVTLGTLTVLPSVIAGVLVGALGGVIGSYIRD